MILGLLLCLLLVIILGSRNRGYLNRLLSRHLGELSRIFCCLFVLVLCFFGLWSCHCLTKILTYHLLGLLLFYDVLGSMTLIEFLLLFTSIYILLVSHRFAASNVCHRDKLMRIVFLRLLFFDELVNKTSLILLFSTIIFCSSLACLCWFWEVLLLLFEQLWVEWDRFNLFFMRNWVFWLFWLVQQHRGHP